MTEQLELLFAREPGVPPRHPVENAYASALTFPATRPYLVANFVQTVDGVVVFGERGGWNASTISMDSAIDRYVMALVRAVADAIIIGAGTFRVARNHQWSPGGLVPEQATAFDELRTRLRGPGCERAPLYVVTASGRLDRSHVALTSPETRVSIVTTDAGAARLAGSLPPEVEVISTGGRAEVDPDALVHLVAERSGGLLLCEGGPHLLGDLERAGLVDELFLTVAPQIAGRDVEHRRLGLVEGFAATPDAAPKLELHSLRRAHDHLFLRYRRAGGEIES
jgi:riboflavin biosynthesis pyrimidine reductase